MFFMPDRTRARELAAEYIRNGDPTGWFETLYQEAEAGKSVVPWADFHANCQLLGFWKNHPQETAGKLALVIGSGLGDDAEQFSAWGYRTTAFDISETAIRTTRKRYPHSVVNYMVSDLLHPPSSLFQKFDFVFEANTLQVLPPLLRAKAMEKTASFVRPGGLLLVICRGRQPSDPEGQMPWPLTREELSAFVASGFQEVSFEEIPEPDEPGVCRFRILYRLPEKIKRRTRETPRRDHHHRPR
jgi:SAM-dependent methyltransferase